jgi:hypothetical protein
MRLLVLTALLVLVFGTYMLLRSARDLGADLGAMATEQGVAAGTPRLLNRAAVPLNDGVAIFKVRCESDQACGGTVTITLQDPKRVGTAAYSIEPNQVRDLGVLLPAGPRATRGTLTWRETSGATAANDFTIRR